MHQLALTAAPAVDRLLLVADHEHLTAAAADFLDDGTEEMKLQPTRVLELIEEHVLEARPEPEIQLVLPERGGSDHRCDIVNV